MSTEHQEGEEEAVTATAAGGSELDRECLWSKLPPELLVKVSFLSVPTLFRCRAVCKKWNNLITSPEFAALCAQAPIEKSHVILVGLPGLSSLWLAYMYDTHANKWCHPIDLKFLQPHWELIFGDATKGLVRRRVLAASGSMACVSATYIKGSEALVACNPVRKTFEVLPLVGSCASFGACGLVHITVDAPTASYKIFYLEFLFDSGEMTASEDKCSQFHVYESSVGEWRILSRIAKGLYHEQSVDRCSMVHFNDVIYVLWYEDLPTSYRGNGKHVLMAYHLLQGMWKEVGCEFSTSLRRVKLLVSGQWLLLVGALEDTYHIWKLHITTNEYYEIARMPDFYTRRMLDDPFNALICGYGESVFLMSAKGKPVLYDLATGNWQRLPSLSSTLQDTLPQFIRSNLFENFIDFCMDVPLSY
ncbi:hypothetical protein M758_2G225000 [Ceratodon purpureus]|nr:hypothetical protein M758_2G225000 [Ceratodon purpureus]